MKFKYCFWWMNILSADKMNAMCVAECAISRTHRLPANENRLHFYTTERIDASEIIGDSSCQQAEFSCNRYSQLDSPFDGFGMEMKNLHRVYNKTECFYFKLSRIVQAAEEKKNMCKYWNNDSANWSRMYNFNLHCFCALCFVRRWKVAVKLSTLQSSFFPTVFDSFGLKQSVVKLGVHKRAPDARRVSAASNQIQYSW